MSLNLIIGSMFSGKTTELIKYYNKYSMQYNTIIINHTLDNRYNNGNVICTHNNISLKAIKLKKLKNIDKYIYENSEYILIDEGHFFSDLVVFILHAIIKDNKNIIIVGLNGDYNGNPFKNITDLIPHANKVIYMTSICNYCKIPTQGFMHKKIKKTEQTKNRLIVGGISDYVCLCRKHYYS